MSAGPGAPPAVSHDPAFLAPRFRAAVEQRVNAGNRR